MIDRVTDLKELIEHVEKATGPDRELDHRLQGTLVNPTMSDTDLDEKGLADAAKAICDPDRCVALNEPERPPCDRVNCDSFIKAEAAIRTYKAAVGEPVAWMHPTAGWAATSHDFVTSHCRKDGPQPVPLYAAPQPSQSLDEGVEGVEVLTVDQIEAIIVATEPDLPASVNGDKIWTKRMAHALHARLLRSASPQREAANMQKVHSAPEGWRDLMLRASIHLEEWPGDDDRHQREKALKIAAEIDAAVAIPTPTPPKEG